MTNKSGLAESDLVMGRVGWFLLIVLSVLWGGSFFFAKVALVEIGPLTLVLLRVAIAALALAAVLKLKGQRVPQGTYLWKNFFAMGAINNLIPFSLLFWGQTQISGGLASVLTATTPAFTVLVAHFATTDEKLTFPKVAGVVLGLLGVAVLFGLELAGGLWWLLAMLACLVAAFSYSLATVYGRRFQRWGVNPLAVAFGQVSATTVMMIPLAMLAERPWQLDSLAGSTVLAVLALGLLSTALAYVLFFRILASGGATNISLVTFLIPVSAIGLGSLFLDERLALSHLVGIGVIFLGLAFIDGRLVRLAARLLSAPKASRGEPFSDLVPSCDQSCLDDGCARECV